MRQVETALVNLSVVVMGLPRAGQPAAAQPAPLGSKRSDTAMLLVLRGKLRQAEGASRGEALIFGGSDDLRRRLVPGLHDDSAWAVSSGGTRIWRYESESGHSWLLPEGTSGGYSEHSFRLLASVSIDKLLNEIAWIEAGRPEFKSRTNPDGWTWNSHKDVDIAGEHIDDRIPF